MSPVRLLLVDDADGYRQGLRLLLRTTSVAEVVGEATNGRNAIDRAHRLRPDVVLMDLEMPVMDGVEATRRLTAELPAIRVLALTTFDDDHLVFGALRAGAAGYLLKDATPAELFDAIAAVARGESWLHPNVAAKVVAEFARLSRRRPAHGAVAPDPGLSTREVEVLRVLSTGASNKEIATALYISEGTVKNHLTHVFDKLGVTDRVQAALSARDLGLV